MFRNLIAFSLGAVVALPALAESPIDAPPLDTVLVANGLVQPVLVTYATDNPGRVYILEKRGKIQLLDLGSNTVSPEPFLDIEPLVNTNGSERGMLGLAFHPDYAENRRFYVYYTGETQPGESVIAEYHRSMDDPDTAIPDGNIIMTFSQPAPIHQAGWLGFGPDGLLYIANGDGGLFSTAQDLTSPLGKMLRVDVDGDDFPLDEDKDYAIPAENPFVGNSDAGAVWAYGLRNPWRCSFDRATGDLYIGDVGENLAEEVCLVPAGSGGGQNFGWPCLEGSHCTGRTGCVCDDETLIAPIHAYDHIAGPNAAIGGIAYRSNEIPALQGTYFLANWGSAHVWTFRYDPETGISDFTDRYAEFGVGLISSFGEDAAGNIYACVISGQVYRIILGAPAACADLDDSGDVGIDDLVMLIESWGACPDLPAECVADVNQDGVVDVNDLVTVVVTWGPC